MLSHLMTRFKYFIVNFMKTTLIPIVRILQKKERSNDAPRQTQRKRWSDIHSVHHLYTIHHSNIVPNLNYALYVTKKS